jgi:hypothetical protein
VRHVRHLLDPLDLEYDRRSTVGACGVGRLSHLVPLILEVVVYEDFLYFGESPGAELHVIVDRFGVAVVDGDVLLTCYVVAVPPVRVRVRQIFRNLVPEGLSSRQTPEHCYLNFRHLCSLLQYTTGRTKEIPIESL